MSPSDSDDMSAFISLSMDSPDDDLNLRAPYIPMGEDLPLMMSSDLMWGAPLAPTRTGAISPVDSGGGSNDSNSSSTWTPSSPNVEPDPNSSLAQLLQADLTSNRHRSATNQHNDHSHLYSRKGRSFILKMHAM